MNINIRVINTSFIVAMSLVAIIAFSSCNKNEKAQELLKKSNHIANYGKMSDLSVNYDVTSDDRLKFDSLADFRIALDEVNPMVYNDSVRKSLIQSQENEGFYSLLGKYQDLLDEYDSLSSETEFNAFASENHEYFEIDSFGVHSDYMLELIAFIDTTGFMYIDSAIHKFKDDDQYIALSGDEDSISNYLDGIDTSGVYEFQFRAGNSSASCPDYRECSDRSGGKRVKHHRSLYELTVPLFLYNPLYNRFELNWEYNVIYSAVFQSQKKFLFWWIRNKKDEIAYSVDYSVHIVGPGSSIFKSDFESGSDEDHTQGYYKDLFYKVYNSAVSVPSSSLDRNTSSVENKDKSGLICTLTCQ